MDGYEDAVRQLPVGLASVLARVPAQVRAQVTEIRLRSGRPVMLTAPAGGYYVQADGQVVARSGPANVRMTEALMAEAFRAVCGHSVHTAQRAVDQGFVSMPGGHRAGVCGTAFWRSDGTMGVGQITSINIRIARFLQLDLPQPLRRILCTPQQGVLIAGEPGSGKTTVLRSAAAFLSEQGRRVAVVDERCELAPSGCLWPDQWDVLSGYPKAVGMMQALRGLCPDVIVCDEIGTAQDVQAVMAAVGGGAGVLATIHGGSWQSLRRRPQYRQLMATGAFGYVAFLKGCGQPGAVGEVMACDAAV